MQLVLLRVLQVQFDIHRASALRSQVIFRRIHRDPVKPRVKRTVTAKPGQRPVSLEESLLGDVQSKVRIPYITHHQINDFMLVFKHQQIESTFVTLLDTPDQLGIGKLSGHTLRPHSKSGSANRLPDRPGEIRKVRCVPHPSWVLCLKLWSLSLNRGYAKSGRWYQLLSRRPKAPRPCRQISCRRCHSRSLAGSPRNSSP